MFALGLSIYFAFVTPGRAFPIAAEYKSQPVQNAPDPAIAVVTKPGAKTEYYLYSSNGPLNDNDRDPAGKLNIHLMPIFRSTDLVHWEYVDDVFKAKPKWASESRLIGPEIQSFGGKYFLYYTAVDEDAQGNARNGGAIGVATSLSPSGPWTDSGKQVVEVQTGRLAYDPFVISDDAEAAHGQRYLFYGSYAGGLFARKLSADGLSTDPSSDVAIAVPDRYEAAFIQKHDGFYYLFASSGNCCNVELTGYSVMVGRSRNLFGHIRIEPAPRFSTAARAARQC